MIYVRETWKLTKSIATDVKKSPDKGWKVSVTNVRYENIDVSEQILIKNIMKIM